MGDEQQARQRGANEREPMPRHTNHVVHTGNTPLCHIDHSSQTCRLAGGRCLPQSMHSHLKFGQRLAVDRALQATQSAPQRKRQRVAAR